MEVLLDVTVLFALVLALSLIIERFLEILKTIYDLVDSQLNWHSYWTRRTCRIRDRLEKRIRIFDYMDPKHVASILYRFRGMILNQQGAYSGTVPVLSGDLVRAVYIKLSLKCVAIILGIGMALWLKIDLLEVWQAASKTSKWEIYITSSVLRMIFTGIVIGLGSGPVHKMITSIERKSEKRQPKGELS